MFWEGFKLKERGALVRKECNRARKLRIICMNARSILNKIDELRVVVQDCRPDIIGITESWCHSSITNAELEILGYQLYREDRLDTFNGRGGGVLLYVSDKISSLEVDSIVGGDGFNIKFCKLQFQGGIKTTVGLVYKSPNISEYNELDFIQLLENVKDKHIVYFGDFNYPNINWTSLADRKQSFSDLQI